MKGFETIRVTKDEDGNDVKPYDFTRVCETSWQRNNGNWVSVSNNLPEGFSEAVDLEEE